MLAQIIYAIFHFREYLFPLLQTLGNWSYVLIFAIIFMETGLVVFPFLLASVLQTVRLIGGLFGW